MIASWLIQRMDMIAKIIKNPENPLGSLS